MLTLTNAQIRANMRQKMWNLLYSQGTVLRNWYKIEVIRSEGLGNKQPEKFSFLEEANLSEYLHYIR